MHDLTKGSIARNLIQTASFMLVGMVFQTLYFLVDLKFVGMLGPTALLFVICRTVPERLVGLFNKDPHMLAVGGEYLKILAWNFVPSGIVFVSSSMFQALGNTLPPLLSSFLRTSLQVIPAYFMSHAAGFALNWIWYLGVGCVALHALLNILFLQREYRRKLSFAAPAPAPVAPPAME